MADWTEYLLALSLFILSHFAPRIGGLREMLLARFGRTRYFLLYGVISTGLLGWLVVAAGQAPFIEVWPQTHWTRWVPNLVMPIASVLFALGVGIRQPFTLGGKRAAEFDADDPGMAAVSRHPLFLALALWALAHLFPNGDLAHIILFGLFALLAIAAIPAFDMRARRLLKPERSKAYFDATAIFSLWPLASPDWRAKNLSMFLARALAGLTVWGLLFALHEPVIGMSPMIL